MTPIALLACAVAVADWGPIRLGGDGVPLPPGVIARVGRARFRHEGCCSRIHFPADGRHLLGVTATQLYTWDARTGLILRIDDLGGYVVDSALRPDGAFVYVVRSGKGSEAILCERSLQPIGTSVRTVLTFDDGGSCLSPDGTRLAVRNAGLVRLFDTAEAKPVGETRLSISDYEPRSLAVSPDNRRVLASFQSWTEVREFDNGNVVFAEAPAGEDEIREAVFSPDGREVLCAVEAVKEGAKNRLEAIDLKSGKINRLYESGARLGKMVASPDGRAVYSAARGDLVRIDRATGAATTLGVAAATCSRPFVSPDGRQLLTAGDGFRVTAWDPQTGRQTSPDDVEVAGRSIAFSTDGRRLLLNDLESGGVQAADAVTGRLVRTIRFGYPEDVYLLPNGTEYAFATAKSLQVRHLATDAVSFAGKIDQPFCPTLHAAGRGRFVFTYGETQIDAWDVGAKKPLPPAFAPTTHRRAFHVTPDGRWALIGDLEVVDGRGLWNFRLVDFATRQPHAEWPTVRTPDWRMTFDPAGTLALFQNARQQMALLELPHGRERPFRMPITQDELDKCSFSHDGRSVAGPRREGKQAYPEVQIFETSSGKLRHTFRLGEDCLGTAFSPDGRSLAAISPRAPLYFLDLRGALLNHPKTLDLLGLESQWKKLLGDNAEEAFGALQVLAAAPESAVAFIRAIVPPAKAPAPKELDALVQSLEAPAFRDREAAVRELNKLVHVVEGELRAAERRTESPEVRQRLEKVLRTAVAESPEAVRRSRTVEVVEWCGTPDAKKLLREWAAGAPGAALTREATLALARLGG